MFGSDDSSGFPQSDVMVLAEDTAQVASGEKDGTGTGSTGDTGLLPIMQRGSGSHNICRLATISHATIQAIGMTGPGTQDAVGHDFLPQIVIALQQAKNQGLSIPIVYNTGSYESPEALRHLDGLVDIYLPDLKYFSPELSAAYSHAPDYFEIACAAIAEMYRQVLDPVMDPDTGLMQRGMTYRLTQSITS